MQLLRGEGGQAAAHALTQSGLVAVAVNPGARDGHGLEIIALGTPSRAVLLDAQATDLTAWLQHTAVLGGFEAKALHGALLRHYGAGPARWGCVRICEQLLLGGRDEPLDLPSIAARHEIPEPPPVESGLMSLARHVQAVACLLHRQGEALQQHGLGQVSKLEAAAVAPIAEMELRGMPFDASRWERLAHKHAGERQALGRQIIAHLQAACGNAAVSRDIFGTPTCNLDNDSALLAALRAANLRIDNVRKGTLKELPAPLGPWLGRYRTLGKFTHTYGTSFLQKVGQDGRLHPTFEQIGASTGRMACHSPNLQAVVKKTEHRACFVAPAGRRLVIADYNACELRILAEMSGDPVFCEAFARDEDVHSQVASRVFGRPVSKDSAPELRQIAKAVSFGLAYGMGAAGLARTLRMDLPAARRLLQRYFETFPRIGGFLQQAAAAALQRGHACTLSGRRLYLNTATFANDRAAAERVAKNMPIQGTNADIIKIALARLHQALAAIPHTGVVHCVHDEIVVECPDAAAPGVRDTLVTQMEQAAQGLLKNVRLTVDARISATWDAYSPLTHLA